MNRAEEHFFLRARYNNVTKYIYFSELSVESFLDRVCKEFGLAGSVSFLLFDNVDAPIQPNKFVDVFNFYGKQASFYIKIFLEMLDDKPVVTVKEWEEYLKLYWPESLEKVDESLNNAEQNRLIRHAGNFAQRRFGSKPSAVQQDAIAMAIVGLFSKVKLDTIRNTKDGGKLGIRLRNKRHAEKDVQDHQNQLQDQLQDDVSNDEESNNEVELLKTMIVNAESISEIKTKLMMTYSYKMKLLKHLGLNIREYFSYFFVSAELISYEFSLHYSHINKNAFDEAWSLYSGRVIDVLKSHYGRDIPKDWSTEVTQLLTFFKLLPAKITKDNLLTVEAFKKAVNKLIVFRQNDCAVNMLFEDANKFPYIIAVGNSKKELTHFYIEIEREILNVPIDFTIGQTFDLFFKVHKIFRMNCDPNLQRLFQFCAYYAYKIEEDGKEENGKKAKKFKPSSAMDTLYGLLNDEH